MVIMWDAIGDDGLSKDQQELVLIYIHACKYEYRDLYLPMRGASASASWPAQA